jgi:hypothetical protein
MSVLRCTISGHIFFVWPFLQRREKFSNSKEICEVSKYKEYKVHFVLVQYSFILYITGYLEELYHWTLDFLWVVDLKCKKGEIISIWEYGCEISEFSKCCFLGTDILYSCSCLQVNLQNKWLLIVELYCFRLFLSSQIYICMSTTNIFSLWNYTAVRRR